MLLEFYVSSSDFSLSQFLGLISICLSLPVNFCLSHSISVSASLHSSVSISVPCIADDGETTGFCLHNVPIREFGKLLEQMSVMK